MSQAEQFFPHAVLYGVRTSKITVPIVPEGIIVKNRHKELLRDSHNEGSHVILVSAPAGYGKTTLISSWLSSSDAAVAWLTLDKNDDDLQRFFRTIVASFGNQYPIIEVHLSSLINLSLVSGIETAAEMIAYEIEQNSTRLYLVLDDAHTVDNPSVLLFIQHLIDIMPDNLCIVLVSRADPPLKLARLRIQNSLTEIRIDELRLNREEIKDILSDKTGITLSDEALTAIEQRTEGWIAGIQLLCTAMRESKPENLDGFFENFFNSHKYIVEYLAEEILSQLPQELVTFMCSSSIFDFFNAEVCDFTFEYTDSSKMIEKLVTANLLIHPLDDSAEWYQYHPLLRNYLRTIAGEIDQKKYIESAGWYEKHGFMLEAMRLAVESGNEEKYFSALDAEAEKLFSHGEYRALSRWLAHLPDDFYSKHTQFHVYRAWSILAQGNKRMARDLAESLLDSDTLIFDDDDRARLECLLAISIECADEDYCTELISGIEGKTANNDSFIRIIIKLLEGNIAFRHKKYPEAERLYRAAQEISEAISKAYLSVCSVYNLSFTLIQEGKWNQVKQLCTRELEKRKIRDNHLQPLAEILYLPLSRVLRKSESDMYSFDLALRGEEACRRFSFSLLVNHVGEDSPGRKTQNSHPDPLSRRELDVLHLVAKGYSNADIADTLFISLGTVKWHINNIFSKLDIKNRTQAVLKAEEYKLI